MPPALSPRTVRPLMRQHLSMVICSHLCPPPYINTNWMRRRAVLRHFADPMRLRL
ncbi:hypothetical protein B0H19DRAFT_1122693 [Mycena capillaripes]|nr:hypothetical protein B0H19DRAFT_1122693 [Mycena capillaripes]